MKGDVALFAALAYPILEKTSRMLSQRCTLARSLRTNDAAATSNPQLLMQHFLQKNPIEIQEAQQQEPLSLSRLAQAERF